MRRDSAPPLTVPASGIGGKIKSPRGLAGEDAKLRTRTRRTIEAAILFALPIDEPLRKEYLLRRWRGSDG